MKNVHPRPQFRRENWLDLDGVWDYEFDFSDSGAEKNWAKNSSFSGKINVPFAPESKLSGVGFTDFIEHLWYHKTIEIPASWQSKRALLHFGGIDYRCEIYLDGTFVGEHTGLDSFEIAIDAAPGSKHELVIRVEDLQRTHEQPFGKQAPWLISAHCSYTRTTGIFQSVWLEELPEYGLKRCRIVPDFDGGSFLFVPEFQHVARGMKFCCRILDNGKIVKDSSCTAFDGGALNITLDSPKAWEPGSPFLYDLEFEVRSASGELLDRVYSYAGLRKIHIEKDRFYLNNKPVFLRFVLDQGFYEEGLWTAPDDEALKHDIELSMAAGFNGARLHQKIFSERFHYWADKLGYLTWAEFPDWGIGFWQHFTKKPVNFNRSFRDYLVQWSAVVQRDFNHPSIIAWTPFNETRSMSDMTEHRRIIRDVYDLTKRIDPTRPVNDTSGYTHVCSDIWSVHTYAQEPDALAGQLNTEPVFKNFEEDAGYCGQPYVPDEFGGVRYVPPERRKDAAANAWGYSSADTAEAAEKRIAAQTAVIVGNPRVAGYCYTQLTDIEQEQNGIYNYDRTEKFNMKKIHDIFSAKPEWSEI